MTVKIDVISDVMCPWCYIGKRNLEAALKLVPDADVEITWRPYQLDPTLPKTGKDRQQYLTEKFGAANAKSFYERIREAGAALGIEFKFDDISVSPNTLDAHRVIHWAGGQSAEIQDKIVERLFELYFLEGGHIGENDILAEAAASAGMDQDIVKDLLESDSDVEQVNAHINHAKQMGVTGVPCYVFDNKFAVVGAQGAEQLANAIREAITQNDKAD